MTDRWLPDVRAWPGAVYSYGSRGVDVSWEPLPEYFDKSRWVKREFTYKELAGSNAFFVREWVARAAIYVLLCEEHHLDGTPLTLFYVPRGPA